VQCDDDDDDDDAFERQHPVMYLDLDAWCNISPPIDSLTHFPFPSEFCSFCLIVRSMHGFQPGQVCSKEYLLLDICQKNERRDYSS
jgi:hypothetical protein